MKEKLQAAVRGVARPLAVGLHRLGVSPDGLTLIGLLLTGVAAWFLAEGAFRLAALVLLVGSVCDMLDGDVARLSGRASVFGAFLDSTVDRVAELLMFLGLMIYYVRMEADILTAGLCLVVAGGSFTISYARARAEGLGVDCKVGLMERPERLVLVLIGALLGPLWMTRILWLLGVLVWFTVMQRVVHVYRSTR